MKKQIEEILNDVVMPEDQRAAIRIISEMFGFKFLEVMKKLGETMAVGGRYTMEEMMEDLGFDKDEAVDIYLHFKIIEQ